MRQSQRVWAAGPVLLALLLVIPTRGDDKPATGSGREIPASLAPFEYLVGSWKGTARPTANPIRGWQETHAWAWAFEKGVPVALTFQFEGSKLVSSGRLSYDAAEKKYQIDGKGADGKPVAFRGGFDTTGRQLVLDRTTPTADGTKQRITLFPNSSFIRYTVVLKEQAAGSPQFKNALDLGLTKEGEAFAAGSAAVDLPKCIVTGGAATMTVTYEGRTFPLCCSGCREEFNENPQKYIKKASLAREAAASKPAAKTTSAVNKDDGAFDGLGGDEPAAGKTAAPKAGNSGTMKKSDTTPRAAPKAESDAERKAASSLRLGQNLEKSGKTAAALGYYRQIVKDYPRTAAAKTAAERIKALAAGR